MNPEDVKALIDQLLHTGEILATQAYILAVKQAMIQSMQLFIWSFILFLLTILLFFAGRKQYKIYQENRENEDAAFLTGAYWIFSLIGLLIFTRLMTIGIGYYMNPEWRAVEILLGAFLGK
ncbi:MAG: hypothetical protein EHM20_11150 [Alphaproteobacteria bacterium]|nr:MAG: hypothetical protein EHM20_11150 [Alphaproteobacteria bacterium]